VKSEETTRVMGITDLPKAKAISGFLITGLGHLRQCAMALSQGTELATVLKWRLMEQRDLRCEGEVTFSGEA